MRIAKGLLILACASALGQSLDRPASQGAVAGLEMPPYAESSTGKLTRGEYRLLIESSGKFDRWKVSELFVGNLTSGADSLGVRVKYEPELIDNYVIMREAEFLNLSWLAQGIARPGAEADWVLTKSQSTVKRLFEIELATYATAVGDGVSYIDAMDLLTAVHRDRMEFDLPDSTAHRANFATGSPEEIGRDYDGNLEISIETTQYEWLTYRVVLQEGAYRVVGLRRRGDLPIATLDSNVGAGPDSGDRGIGLQPFNEPLIPPTDSRGFIMPDLGPAPIVDIRSVD